jgi:hypothetical protein
LCVASVARSASSASGRPADEGLKSSTHKTFSGFHPRTIARLMTIGADLLTKAETLTVAAIEAGLPSLVEAREIIAEFRTMILRKAETGLTQWIDRASPVSLLPSPAASRKMKWRFGPQSVRRSPTERLKVRSPASSSCDNRSASGQANRRRIISCTNIASEPKLNAD